MQKDRRQSPLGGHEVHHVRRNAHPLILELVREQRNELLDKVLKIVLGGQPPWRCGSGENGHNLAPNIFCCFRFLKRIPHNAESFVFRLRCHTFKSFEFVSVACRMGTHAGTSTCRTQNSSARKEACKSAPWSERSTPTSPQWPRLASFGGETLPHLP